MGAVNTNGVSLAAIREVVYGQLPDKGIAEYLEPNEISNYGAEITTTSRSPISKYRMGKKGTITDVTSSVQFQQDTTTSLLLQFLSGGIYSKWLQRPHFLRRDFAVLSVGEQTDPHYRGEYADVAAAVLNITNPEEGDWWNNSTDNLEYVYSKKTNPNPAYRGSYANAAAATAAITNPKVGDYFDNREDGLEWDYVNKTIPNNNYKGSYANAEAATAAISRPYNFAMFWDNTTTNTEWDYDGTNVPAPGFLGTFASEAEATAAATNPQVGDWWNNSTTSTEWNCTAVNSGTPVWENSNNAIGTRPSSTQRLWKDTNQPIGTTPKTIPVPWEASSRLIGTTPSTITTYWEASTKTAFTTPTTINSNGGYRPDTEMSGAVLPGSLIYVRGFVHEVNNGLKVVSEDSTKSLIGVTSTGIVAENGNPDTSLFVCGYQGNEGDIQLNAEGNLISTTLDFTTLGLEIGSGIFIGGVDPDTRFAGEQNYGLCRIREVTPHLITLDKRPNAFTQDDGAGKQIHLYFGWFIKDVAVDDPLFAQHSFSFELSYPGLMDGNKEGYEYAVGQVVNTMELSLPLTDKSTSTISTIGKDVQPIVSDRLDMPHERPLFQEAFSTPNDFIRLRLDRVDGYGLSTLFKECTLTLNNNAGSESVLAHLGPMFTNYGNFDVTMAFQCIFTNPEVTKMIRNNCTVTMDFCLVNNDGAFYFDIPSMTLGNGAKNFATNEKVKIDLTSTAFGDPNPGYTFGVTFFPYLPNPKADACA